eukprot:gene11625-24347_t
MRPLNDHPRKSDLQQTSVIETYSMCNYRTKIMQLYNLSFSETHFLAAFPFPRASRLTLCSSSAKTNSVVIHHITSRNSIFTNEAVSNTIEDRNSSLGLRVDAKLLSKIEFQANFECSWPVVITNVFDVDNELWTEQLLERFGERDVQFDIRRSSDGFVETFEATLRDFIGSILDDSTHDESWYLMDEDMLQEDEFLNAKLKLPERLFGIDIFQYFPEDIRPRTALIIGGEGARSFLHADPYEWTGWNYLLEGRKLWTFFPPNMSVASGSQDDALLGAHRNPPDAWGSFNLSAGWVSDLDLYRHRSLHTISSSNSSCSGNKTPADTTKAAIGDSDSLVGNNIGMGASRLLGKLSEELITALSEGTATATGASGVTPMTQTTASDSGSGTTVGSSSETNCLPTFSSGTDLDDVIDPRLFGGGGAIQIEQREGEMVIIPPKWWHQVYHLEPSIAVAGQFVGELGRDRLFRHMLTWCGSAASGLPEEFQEYSVENQVLAVIRLGLRTRMGRLMGDKAFRKLTVRDKTAEKKGKDRGSS